MEQGNWVKIIPPIVHGVLEFGGKIHSVKSIRNIDELYENTSFWVQRLSESYLTVLS